MAVTDRRGVVGLVLAGGRSTRMGGGDKCLLPLGRGTVLSHVTERLRPQVASVVLNANGDPSRFADYGYPVVADGIDCYAGPLAGVLAGLDWAAERGFEHMVTAAADTPFFPSDLVVALEAAAVAGRMPLAMAMTPRDGGGLDRHPTFGWWPVEVRAALRYALAGGVRKVVEFTGPVGCAKAIFHDRSPEPFFNVNTPEDLRTARAMLEAREA